MGVAPGAGLGLSAGPLRLLPGKTALINATIAVVGSPDPSDPAATWRNRAALRAMAAVAAYAVIRLSRSRSSSG